MALLHFQTSSQFMEHDMDFDRANGHGVPIASSVQAKPSIRMLEFGCLKQINNK